MLLLFVFYLCYRFKVISFSSEDPDNPAEQLNAVNPSTKGLPLLTLLRLPK